MYASFFPLVNFLLLESKQGARSNTPRIHFLDLCHNWVFYKYLFCLRMEGTVMSYACYCLLSETGKTYVGFTVNLERRLRQHNAEIQGGAKATKGQAWKRVLSVVGFPSQQAALQFEWKWKYLTRKAKGSAVERRCQALIGLLNDEQSTSNAIPFSRYDGPVNVCVEDPCVELFLKDKEMRYGCLIE